MGQCRVKGNCCSPLQVWKYDLRQVEVDGISAEYVWVCDNIVTLRARIDKTRALRTCSVSLEKCDFGGEQEPDNK